VCSILEVCCLRGFRSLHDTYVFPPKCIAESCLLVSATHLGGAGCVSKGLALKCFENAFPNPTSELPGVGAGGGRCLLHTTREAGVCYTFRGGTYVPY